MFRSLVLASPRPEELRSLWLFIPHSWMQIFSPVSPPPPGGDYNKCPQMPPSLTMRGICCRDSFGVPFELLNLSSKCLLTFQNQIQLQIWLSGVHLYSLQMWRTWSKDHFELPIASGYFNFWMYSYVFASFCILPWFDIAGYRGKILPLYLQLLHLMGGMLPG